VSRQLVQDPGLLAVPTLPLPRISIVTPNYNYGHFLEATLGSVLDQSYPDLEYIVIDDGSTDNSVEVIKRYESRLAFWRTGANQGQYKTITEGMNRATGDVLGWINSDDMHMPWTLRAVGQIFSTFPTVEWITTLSPALWDYDGFCIGLLGHAGFSREAYLDGLYLTGANIDGQWTCPRPLGFIQQESTFWRRSLWEKTGGLISTDYGSAGDFDLWGRFFEHTDLVGVAMPLAGFRLQHTQQTANMSRYSDSCSRSLKDARKRAGWGGPRAAVRMAYGLGLPDLPKIRRWTRRSFGYECRIVSRADSYGPVPRWKLATHPFM
jgi:hypothetical protein